MKYETIPQLFGYGHDGPRQYLIMEYISGGTLTNKIGELEYGETLTIMIDVCNGIHAIHSMKPETRHVSKKVKSKLIMFVQDGRAKVIDVGEMSYVGYKTSYSSSIYKERITRYLGVVVRNATQ
ncbi:hypothetical protein MTR67_041161 [Solanum verrucosum]|uniref:Protein kinase domain-containing protein n=1 Tax=Solanum verrucosum TaxID=315347 RepID=A0AAF0ZQI5_SOLVR|nr:hypothetical protein MTR67_041161 [Solanum verrucosum]